MNNLAPISASGAHNGNVLKQVFVAAPMSGFDSEAEYELHRKQSLKLVEAMTDAGLANDVYYAGTEVTSASNYSGSNTAFHTDVGNLQKSDAMVFLYPRKVATGALVEVGIAIAKCIPLVIFVNDRNDLPYMIRDLQEYDDPEHLAPDILIIETSSPLDEVQSVSSFLQRACSNC